MKLVAPRRSAIGAAESLAEKNGYELVKFFFLLTFAAAIPAIISGGIAERSRFWPQLLATAIIVTQDRFEVIGKGLVAIHDNTRAPVSSEKPYILLAAGDQFDLKTRTTEKAASQTPPAVTPAPRREQ